MSQGGVQICIDRRLTGLEPARNGREKKAPAAPTLLRLSSPHPDLSPLPLIGEHVGATVALGLNRRLKEGLQLGSDGSQGQGRGRGEERESNKVQQRKESRFELLDGSGETIGANLKVPEEWHKRPLDRPQLHKEQACFQLSLTLDR